MKMPLIIVTVSILYGCAGSANHRIVSSHASIDYDLSCNQIDMEMKKAQDIIDSVNDDRNDLNPADVIDGLLWFPFNLIAKSENYKNAINAADKRIEILHELKKDSRCTVKE